MKNIIICGCSGSGKTTAIKRILHGAEEPIYGFWTEKLAVDPQTGSAPVYIHGCSEQLTFAQDHQIGSCRERCAEKRPKAFDTVGFMLLSGIPSGSLVLMDEIGVMEEEAAAFIARVFELLDGDYRVIAAVRDRSTPLLDAVRGHEKSLCVSAAEANTPDFVERARRELGITHILAADGEKAFSELF